MKKTKILSFVLALLLVFSLSGCEMLEDITKFTDMVSELIGKEEAEPPVEDEPEILEPVDPNWPVSAFGVEIESKPEKVAVASPALAEYIFDMGLAEEICAVPDFCGFSGAETKTNIGSVRLPDMDAIKEAAPEYILTFAQYEESLLI